MDLKNKYVPCTPAGTFLVNLASKTKEQAKAKLLEEAAHMPYKTWDNFKKRGYTIERF